MRALRMQAESCTGALLRAAAAQGTGARLKEGPGELHRLKREDQPRARVAAGGSEVQRAEAGARKEGADALGGGKEEGRGIASSLSCTVWV